MQDARRQHRRDRIQREMSQKHSIREVHHADRSRTDHQRHRDPQQLAQRPSMIGVICWNHAIRRSRFMWQSRLRHQRSLAFGSVVRAGDLTA